MQTDGRRPTAYNDLMSQFSALPTSWPVTLEHQRVMLAPLRYTHRRQWYEVRNRNEACLTPLEATDPLINPRIMPYCTSVSAHNRNGAAGASFPRVIFSQDSTDCRLELVGQMFVAPVLWGSMRTT